jgi:hypothetical protein
MTGVSPAGFSPPISRQHIRTGLAISESGFAVAAFKAFMMSDVSVLPQRKVENDHERTSSQSSSYAMAK